MDQTAVYGLSSDGRDYRILPISTGGGVSGVDENLARCSMLADGTNGLVPVLDYAPTASGDITTQNLVPTGAATAGSAVEIDCTRAGSVNIQVTGTHTGDLSIQASIDGTTWVTVGGSQVVYNVAAGLFHIQSVIKSGGTGIYQVNTASGYKYFRVTALAAVTGTATITLIACRDVLSALGSYSTTFLASQGRVFLTSTPITQAAVVASYSAVQLYNPVGSGVVVWFAVGALTTWAASGSWAIRYNNTPRATNVGAQASMLPGFGNSQAIVYKEALAALPASNLFPALTMTTAFAGTSALLFQANAYFLLEGQGIEIVQQTANVALNAFLMWGEIPNK